MASAAPVLDGPRRSRSARLHLLGDGARRHLFDVESGSIREVPSAVASALDASLLAGDPMRAEFIASALGMITPPGTTPPPPEAVAVRAISLAIAQKCNLGCTYCYAQQGGFGGKPKDMPEAIARAAVDQLLSATAAGGRATVAFMGGEPLSNRDALHAVTAYASEEAARRQVAVDFAITTNATILAQEDIDLFQRHPFTVTVSIDGIGAAHDSMRPFAGGRGSFARVACNVRRLATTERRRFGLLARATVTPRNLELRNTLAGVVAMGVDSVMFTPLLNAPSADERLAGEGFAVLLEQMSLCADDFLSEARRGRVLPFANLTGMLRRIHNYRREQYPCGAGGGYLAASADGSLSACHRFVEDPDGLLGDVTTGVSPTAQRAWLSQRNLQNQSPCGGCWARHLCAGSCHYDVMKAGRPACDYIRGWAELCLKTYASLASEQPQLLDHIVRNG